MGSDYFVQGYQQGISETLVCFLKFVIISKATTTHKKRKKERKHNQPKERQKRRKKMRKGSILQKREGEQTNKRTT